MFGTTQRQMIYADKNCRPCLKLHTYVGILQCSTIIVCSVVFQITPYHFALSDNSFLTATSPSSTTDFFFFYRIQTVKRAQMMLYDT